ncbi:MAG: hypothetical protein ACR2PL_03395 [Dehalococcoidia bacterium]
MKQVLLGLRAALSPTFLWLGLPVAIALEHIEVVREQEAEIEKNVSRLRNLVSHHPEDLWHDENAGVFEGDAPASPGIVKQAKVSAVVGDEDALLQGRRQQDQIVAAALETCLLNGNSVVTTNAKLPSRLNGDILIQEEGCHRCL